LYQIHYHAALGRELYQLALDYYVHDYESAGVRLAEAVRIVNAEIQPRNQREQPSSSGTISKAFVESLRDWVGISIEDIGVDEAKKRFDALKKTLENSSSKQLRNSPGAEAYGARFLLIQQRKMPIGRLMRRLQALQGYKLEQLLSILEKAIKENEQEFHRWQPFRLYLKIRSSNKNGKSFHDKLISATSLGAQGNERPERPDAPNKAYMLTRICTAEPIKTNPDRDNVIKSMSLLESISDPSQDKPTYRWHREIPQTGEIEAYFTLLGRYDILAISETRPMSRSPVPKFRSHTPTGGVGRTKTRGFAMNVFRLFLYVAKL
ncbi:MAG: hypothetical protein ACRERU_21620, partial [Methylococcales bacterium]